MPIDIALKRVSFPMLSLENRLAPNTEIQLRNKYSSEINVDEEHHSGTCSMTVSIESDSAPFHVNVEMVVSFSFESDTKLDSKMLHKAVQKEAFPYLRSAITGFMAGAYLPPIVIPVLPEE